MAVISQYGDELMLDSLEAPIRNTAVTVKLIGSGTNATLYANIGGSAGTNPLNTDGAGNLRFFSAPGQYDLYVAGVKVNTISVGPLPHAATHAIGGADPITGLGVIFPTGGDDTATLNAALGASKRVVLQAGATFLIAGRVTVSGSASLDGQVSGWPGSGATTIRCTAAGAGLDVSGGNGGEVANLLIDADNTATLPFQRLLSGGGGGFKTFTNVVVFNSAQDNFTLLGPQNDTYSGCQSFSAARDNLYIDKGSGGLLFLNWEDGTCGRYGIHLNALVAGGPFTAGPQQIQFLGGRSEHNGAPGGTSQVYLRHATDVYFGAGFAISGGGNSGPVVDLDMANCAIIDMANASITSSITMGGASPGHVCLQTVNSGGQLWLPHWFVGGDTSWFANTGTSYFIMGGAIFDNTVNGMVAAGGVATPSTLIRNGAAAAWTVVTPSGAWANIGGLLPFAFRLVGGDVELRGGLNGGASASSPFTLPLTLPGGVTVPILCNGGLSFLQVTTGGVSTITQLTGTVNAGIYFDGVKFAAV